jgi:hypothetical protein
MSEIPPSPLTPTPIPELPAKTKSRHGCLTAWLILMLVGSFASIILYLVGNYSMYPSWTVPAMIVFSVINIAIVILLLKWLKIGFWLLCANAILIFIANIIIGVPIYTALGGLVGVAVLYGVLNIGSDNKGWPQLD